MQMSSLENGSLSESPFTSESRKNQILDLGPLEWCNPKQRRQQTDVKVEGDIECNSFCTTCFKRYLEWRPPPKAPKRCKAIMNSVRDISFCISSTSDIYCTTAIMTPNVKQKVQGFEE